MAAPAIVAVDLRRRFGRRVALDGVALTVAPGELCALVGPNGAGKSTLLRIAAGFLDADRGSVAIGGVDVATAPRRAAAHRGYLVEGAPLPPELGVRQYLALRARLRGLGRVDLDGALAEVGLTDRAREPIAALSKGQRQRVAWCEAGLGAPPVLLLDEPAAGLDEAERAAVRARLAAGRGRRAVLWVSHELADVEAIADRIAVLVDGRVAVAGDLAAVRAAAGQGADASLARCVTALAGAA